MTDRERLLAQHEAEVTQAVEDQRKKMEPPDLNAAYLQAVEDELQLIEIHLRYVVAALLTKDE
jgi:hypothetical protein